MKKFLFVFLLLSFTWKFNSQIAFGDGSNGSFTNTISDNVVNQYKRIQSVSSNTFTILNTTNFSCSNGNVVLVINMLSGEYELRQVESVSGSNVTLSAGLIANSNFSSNSQMIKVPQYSNLTINAGSITCPAWDGETGGVICFLVSNTLNLNNGQIDAAGKGFYNGLGGAGGVGGVGGLGGFSGTNLSSNGGQSGYGGSGIGGAGWGGDLGFPPALATAGTTSYFNSLANNLPCGNLVPSCNNSPNPSGRLYMGDGSFGGDGGQGKYGAGGGGSKCNQPGIDGGNGGNGGIGGDGGKGGGIIFINAGNIVHGNTSINVSGTGGTNGLAGTNGGNGGDGTCGGGGGNGADGGDGGGGGHGGAGGAVKIVKSGGLVLSNLVNVQGGPGSNGGAGGAGGFGGVNSTNTSGLCACGTGYSCSFPMLIQYLDDVNTTVSVDGFGNTHFIYINGDSILDLVYFNATFCNGYFIGLLQGQLIEAGTCIATYLAPIASLADNILASLIDFVDNDTPNQDLFGNSILTANYHLINGCVCGNCGASPSVLAEDGDPGNNGPGGLIGGNGYYDEECAAVVTPVFFNQILCQNASPLPLLDVSYNGVSGTWSPLSIQTTAAGNFIYTFTPNAGQCATSTTKIITIIPNVTPTFAAVGPYCNGESIPALPTTSTNSIVGTWSAPISNVAIGTAVTTNYTFTPTPGPGICATTVIMAIVVNPNTIPTFTQLGPYCQGATPDAFPTNSNNGIAGSWSPTTISTTSSGSTQYTFTPTSAAPATCAVPTNMTIVVTTLPMAVISGTATVCENGGQPNVTFTGSNSTPPYTFTYTINGGVPQTVTTSGTNSSVTVAAPTSTTGPFIYALTSVSVGSCSNPVTGSATIAVSPTLTPNFTPVGPYCNGESIPALPTTSTNSIVGTWSPAINNTATTIYTFTPNAGQCATTATMIVAVNPIPIVNPISNFTFCNGSPTNSINFSGNGTSYTWVNNNPTTGLQLSGTGNISSFVATNNTNVPISSTITVVPSGNMCAGTPQNFSITVNPTTALLNSDTVTICSNQSVNLTLVANTNVNFNWYADQSLNVLNESTSTVSSSIINDVLVNNTLFVQQVTYNVFGTSTLNGCSSQIFPITVLVYPSTTSNEVVSSCNSHTWNGVTYTESGVYQYEGISVNGCDSIITLNLTISNDFTSNEVVSSCNSYSWNGVTYTESGVYQYDGVSMSGCDSVATLNLIINLPPNPPSVNVSTNLNGEITCSTPFLNNVTYQWLTCPNYIVIPGANSSNYNPMDNGNYAVVVSNSCGSDTSQCLSENSILDTYETEEIMLYPNPSSGQIIIEAKGIANENFTIYSAEGRKLQVGTLKNGLSVLYIQSFANGSYIFQIAGKQIRFVIQK